MLPVTEEMATIIAQKVSIAVKLAKTLINENQEIKKELEKEINLFAQCFATHSAVWKT